MKKNWLIFLACAVAIAAQISVADDKTIPPASAKPDTKVRVIGVEEFDKLRANRTNIVLDVRTPREFKAGHIPGALNLDFNSPDFDKKVSQLDTNKTYLVHCAAGGRSAKACKKMEALGFKELFDLRPGFTGWEQAGKAVEK